MSSVQFEGEEEEHSHGRDSSKESGKPAGKSRQSSSAKRGSIRNTVANAAEAAKKEEEEQLLKNLAGVPRYVRVSGWLVDSPIFAAITAVLTIHALISDDMRLMYTNKPSDNIFNVLTCVCFTAFSTEIICSCIGKNDYFGGFFFALDFVSTATLILDLTPISDAVLQGDDEDMDDLKSSKTARIGARAARVVRVLRLLRLLKLFKTLQEAHAKHQAKKDDR